MLKSIKELLFGKKKPEERDTPRLFRLEVHAIPCGICAQGLVNNDIVVGYKNSYYHQACWEKEQNEY